MTNDDFGGGDWWEQQPPPPGEYSDEGGTYLDGSDDFGEFQNTPEPGEYLDREEWEITLGISDEVVNVWDFVMNPDNVDPANVRGIGFVDPGEALSWLEEIGLLGISGLYQIDDLWFPVVGSYDDTGE